MSHEILIFADGEKRVIKPAEYLRGNFTLVLLGLCQYDTDIKLSPTIVHRDLQNNIIYFRDVLPVHSTSWDIYMNAVRFNSFTMNDLPELKRFINIIGGDAKVEKQIIEFEKKQVEFEKKQVEDELKYLNPKTPEDDLYNLYMFKKFRISHLTWNSVTEAMKEYTITVKCDSDDHNDGDYHWFRKPIY